MAKTNAHLFSMDASGTLGKATVASRWRGRKYVRQRVVPYNPNTQGQQYSRVAFENLTTIWNLMPALARASWQAAVRGRPITDRNLHLQTNMPLVIGSPDLMNYQMSVRSASSIPPDEATFTPNSGEITAEWEAPPDPPGYIAAGGIFLCIKQVDMTLPQTPRTFAKEGETSPYSVTIDGLEAGDYLCAALMRWQRLSDQKYFFSEAYQDIATVT